MILSVTTVNEKIKNGSTQPFSVKCNNGEIYVLKGINEHCSGHTLLNELVSYRLANLLDLPVPSHEVVTLSQENINSNSEMDTLNFVAGPCFASKYIMGQPRINPLILQKSINHYDIPGIVLFDQFILNTDRSTNDGNFYYDRKSKKLMIIDHTHIFGGWQTWTVKTIEDCITTPAQIINNLNGKNYKYLVPYISGHSPFNKIQERISEITAEDISGLFVNVPLEWEISEKEKKAVEKLISHQIKNLKEILPQLKMVFTQWKGAC